MTSEFLSQDEVDALLKGVNGEAEEAVEEVDSGGVRPYNLATQERIVRGRMPTMEIINERFARLLRTGLFKFMRKSPEISVGPVRVIKYSEFIRNLVVPTNINLVQMKPLRGTALFVFEPAFVFLTVDNLFGGDGRFHNRVEGRDFSATEQRIIQRMLAVVFEEYAKAWAPVYELNFECMRSEMHTQFANIATPSEVVVATSFTIEMANANGAIHICFPYATIEPIRDLIYSPLQGDRMEPDRRWGRMLSRQVQNAEVELQVTLAETQITINDVLNMKVGDVIGIEIPPSLTAKVDGIPVFQCGYGASSGQYALRIESVLSPATEEAMLGEKHA